MPRQNVEDLRRGYEAMNEAIASGEDLAPVIAASDWHPEFRIEMGILEGTFHGPQGFADFLEGQRTVLADLRCEPNEFIEGDNAIVVPMRLTGTSRSTGLPFEYEGVHLWTLRDGRVAHLRLYDSKAKALEAAGLTE